MRNKHIASGDDRRMINSPVTNEFYRQVRLFAAKQDLTVAALIRGLLERELKAQEDKPNGKDAKNS